VIQPAIDQGWMARLNKWRSSGLYSLDPQVLRTRGIAFEACSNQPCQLNASETSNLKNPYLNIPLFEQDPAASASKRSKLGNFLENTVKSL
jgi:hypothetical protein